MLLGAGGPTAKMLKTLKALQVHEESQKCQKAEQSPFPAPGS